MKIRTKIKAGTRRTEEEMQHNQTVARALKFKTNVKVGVIPTPTGDGSGGAPGLSSNRP